MIDKDDKVSHVYRMGISPVIARYWPLPETIGADSDSVPVCSMKADLTRFSLPILLLVLTAPIGEL